jgi:hypothetical protein
MTEVKYRTGIVAPVRYKIFISALSLAFVHLYTLKLFCPGPRVDTSSRWLIAVAHEREGKYRTLRVLTISISPRSLELICVASTGVNSYPSLSTASSRTDCTNRTAAFHSLGCNAQQSINQHKSVRIDFCCLCACSNDAALSATHMRCIYISASLQWR